MPLLLGWAGSVMWLHSAGSLAGARMSKVSSFIYLVPQLLWVRFFFHMVSLFSSVAKLYMEASSQRMKVNMQGLIDGVQEVTWCHLCWIPLVKVSHRPAQIQGCEERHSIFWVREAACNYRDERMCQEPCVQTIFLGNISCLFWDFTSGRTN